MRDMFRGILYVLGWFSSIFILWLVYIGLALWKGKV